ncbi:hypothetical protein SSS_06481 [Sarcoptes scabiei]|uniref:Thyroglobulin type-1 domain-containing protein n=1 Tax=Sarcoptes scabiei TaxID=52283 RepID=A0A834RI01_SARSC|nr:hypothetical protein SSS_06481 [Sarcoptes scabiei]
MINEYHRIEKNLKANSIGFDDVNCDLDGSYSPVQCENDKCYCVDKSGRKYPKTSVDRNDDYLREHSNAHEDFNSCVIDIVYDSLGIDLGQTMWNTLSDEFDNDHFSGSSATTSTSNQCSNEFQFEANHLSDQVQSSLLRTNRSNYRSRLQYTCMDICAIERMDYLALGTNTGSVYVYTRIDSIWIHYCTIIAEELHRNYERSSDHCSIELCQTLRSESAKTSFSKTSQCCETAEHFSDSKESRTNLDEIRSSTYRTVFRSCSFTNDLINLIYFDGFNRLFIADQTGKLLFWRFKNNSI